MKKQARWVIFTFGALVVVGLLWMDRAGSYDGGRQNNIVGKVDGEDIPTDRFQQELKTYLRNEEQRNGKAPEGLQLIQFRQGLFNFKVQALLMERTFKTYRLHASKEEMLDYVIKHPQEVAFYINRFEGPEQLPPFLADSAIDQSRYEAWLSQDSVYDRPAMLAMEEQLRTSVIPQVQLQQIMKSQVHNTFLEEGYTIAMRENKARLQFYHVSADSFPVPPSKFQEPELKAYYESHPDSFHYAEDAARLGYARISLKPSASDTLLMRDFAKELKERALGGEAFSELATDYSNDQVTAPQGGKVAGLRTRDGLDPLLADAAFSLPEGQISDPILTSQGYTLVKVNAKKGNDSLDLSQILLKVTAGNETVDSLTKIAESLREKAKEEGLEKAAKSASVPFEKTPIFDRNNMAPLGTYVQGANSFAFSDFEAKEKVSEPLQAEDALYLFERDGFFDKGRNFERAKSSIGELLAKAERLESAKKELQSRRAEIAAAVPPLPSKVGKASLDSTSSGPISADNWLPGFGYSNPALFKVFTQPVGEWGEVMNTEVGAALSRIQEKAFLSDADIAAKASAQSAQNENYLVSNLYQEWIGSLPKTVKVENKLDMVFRN